MPVGRCYEHNSALHLAPKVDDLAATVGVVSSAMRHELPQRVRAVVGQHVERLGPEALDLICLAGVLGPEFDLEPLLATADSDEYVIAELLNAALSVRLLEEQRVGRHERFTFAGVLIAQVLYNNVPRYRLRRLHLRFAQVLQQSRGSRTGVAAEAARQYETAVDLMLETSSAPESGLAVASVRRKPAHALVALSRITAAIVRFVKWSATARRLAGRLVPSREAGRASRDLAPQMRDLVT